VSAADVAREKSRKRRAVARYASLGAVAVVVGLVVSTGRGALVYSKTVSEVMSEPGRYTNSIVNVEGTVVKDSIQHPEGSQEYNFVISGNGKTMAVHYAGIMPDTFQNDVTVTVKGKLTQGGALFEATEVTAKCASHYEMQQMKARGVPMPANHPHAPATTTP
jgi:cytochrome c-type biogenesis protein CcmE